MAPQASQLYSRNITSFFSTVMKDGVLKIDPKDDVIRGSLVINAGEVVHQATRTAIEGVPAK
jgi:NAD(P) transhydrogenase subunit alpha